MECSSAPLGIRTMMIQDQEVHKVKMRLSGGEVRRKGNVTHQQKAYQAAVFVVVCVVAVVVVRLECAYRTTKGMATRKEGCLASCCPLVRRNSYSMEVEMVRK